MQDLAGIAAHRFVGIKIGIEDMTHLVELQKGLAQQSQLGGNQQACICCRLAHVENDFTDIHFYERGVLFLGDQLSDASAEIGLQEIETGSANADGDVSGLVAVALGNGEEQFQ